MNKSACASDLGLNPGEWPLRLIYSGDPYSRVSYTRGQKGDVLFATYTTINGAHGRRHQTLTVIND